MRTPEPVYPSLDTTHPEKGKLPPVYKMRFSDLTTEVPSGSILRKAVSVFPVERLQKIRHMSFLIFFGESGQILPGEDMRSRWFHSFEVPIILEAILRRNDMTQDKIDMAIIAGLLHDIATPALGDASRKVFPEELDEETNWQELLGVEGRKFLSEYNMDVDSLERIIKNKGLLGQALDVADRVSNVSGDFGSFLREGETRIENPQNIPILNDLQIVINSIGGDFREIGEI